MTEAIAADGGKQWLRAWPALATGLLVVLADYLLFHSGLGLNLFLLSVAAGLAIGLTPPDALRPGDLIWAGLPMLLALPLVEAPSPHAVLLAFLGLGIAALGKARLLPRTIEQVPGVLVRYGLLAPFRLTRDGLAFLAGVGSQAAGKRLARSVIVWIVPGIFALVFLYLFMAANPLIEGALAGIDPKVLLDLLDPIRIIFWGVVASGAWALLMPRLLASTAKPAAPIEARAEGLLFGEAAILRSLLVFNLLFAAQTFLDLTYLWGGVALPSGLSYADYAHRGAYPLIATALLAAGFVLAAMRPGGAGERNRLIRQIVYVFIAQNLLLCISSILRLDLYVEVYSLTELRIAAGIWMGLVAAGLLLILFRILLRKSNAWLVAMNFGTLAATLYVCAFIDFSAAIAWFNVTHSYQVTGKGAPLDIRYLESLGPTVIPALDHYAGLNPASPSGFEAIVTRRAMAEQFLAQPDDWRAWSWRDQRLGDYLLDADIATAALMREKELPPIR